MRFLARLFNAVPKEERDGISLDYRVPQWKVSRAKDLPAFLRALVHLLPQDAILYLEGGSPPGRLRQFLDENSIPEQAHVAMGTIWSRPLIFHVSATAANLSQLADIAEHCAEPEVAMHLHVYRDGKVLLQWYDAFSDPFYISKQIPEEKVHEFCDRLSIQYETNTEGVEPAHAAD